MVNYRGDGKLNSCLVLAGSLTKPTLWFLHYRTPHRAFKMSSNYELTLGRETSLKLRRQPAAMLDRLVHNPRETVFVSKGLRLLSLDPGNTCSQTSFNCPFAWVIDLFCYCVCFPDGLKPSPAARLQSPRWQRNCQRTCFPPGGYLPQSPAIKAPTSLGKSHEA